MACEAGKRDCQAEMLFVMYSCSNMLISLGRRIASYVGVTGYAAERPARMPALMRGAGIRVPGRPGSICDPADSPRPLFDIECANEAFRRMAEARASEVSRKWNLWAPEFEPKFDALRPAAWIMRMNPDYQERASLKGDLRASLLLELQDDPQVGASESELARRCGAERAAIRDALDDLELAGRIERRAEKNRLRILERRVRPHAA